MTSVYTAVHYLLIGLSIMIFASFGGGLVYLLIREKKKGAEAKKQLWKSQLLKRRKAISGRPRHPHMSFSEDSTEIDWQKAPPFYSSRICTETTKSVDVSETPVPVSS